MNIMNHLQPCSNSLLTCCCAFSLSPSNPKPVAQEYTIMLTPYVHAGKQSYVVKAGLHTFNPTGRAYRVVVPDFTLPIPMMLCIWFKVG